MAYATFGKDRNWEGYIRVQYSVSQNAKTNKSTVTIQNIQFQSIEGRTATWTCYGYVDFTGGSRITYNAQNLYTSGTGWVNIGSFTAFSFEISHNSSGAGSFSITLNAYTPRGYSDFNVFHPSGGTTNCEYTGGTSITVDLPTIDRNAPTVTISAGAASSSSISFTVNSSVTSYNWAYQLDGGSWVTFDSQTATQKTYVLTGLSAGTHTIRARATKYSNDVIGYSSTVTVDTALPTVTLSISDITTGSVKLNASSNVNCNAWAYCYKVAGGSYGAWTTFSTTDGTSASTTVTGLSAGTEYVFQVRVKKTSNNLYNSSSEVTAITLGGTLLNSIADFALDPASPRCVMNVTVQGAGFYHQLLIYNEAETLLRTINFTSTWTTTGTQNMNFTVPSVTRSTMLNTFPNAKTCKFKGQLKTYTDSGYTDLIGTSVMREFTCTTSQAVSAPTFSGLFYRDTETETTDLTGDDQVLIQSMSSLLVGANTGVALNGATISGYSVSIGDVSATASLPLLTVGAVTTAGDLTLTMTCIDSRGYSTSLTATVKVLPYAKPRFNTYTLRRRNEIGTLVQLAFTGSISSVMPDSTEKNAVVSIMFKYKKTSEADSAFITVDITADCTISGLSFSYNNQQLFDLDAMTSYDFVFYVYDELGDLSVFILADILNQGTPIVALRKRTTLNNRPRVGINNPEPVYELDVHGDIAMHDFLVQGYVSELEELFLGSLQAGGIYAQSDSSLALTTRSYPVAGGTGLLEVLPTEAGAVIQRYTLFDMTAVYLRCYNGSAWSNWKSQALS